MGVDPLKEIESLIAAGDPSRKANASAAAFRLERSLPGAVVGALSKAGNKVRLAVESERMAGAVAPQTPDGFPRANLRQTTGSGRADPRTAAAFEMKRVIPPSQTTRVHAQKGENILNSSPAAGYPPSGGALWVEVARWPASAEAATRRVAFMGTVGGIHVIGDQTIGNALFTNNLAVPINQRSYKWGKEHVNDLLQDFSAAIAAGNEEYFLGSIVLTKGDGEARPQVVDGQQRLATTMILLAAIRDYFYSNGDKDRADDIQRAYLLNRDLDTQEWTPKFILNEIDSDYFRSSVLLRPDDPLRVAPAANKLENAPASHVRIDNAAKLAATHIAAIVKPYSEQERTARLLAWIKFVRYGARVIWVTVPDEANAFVMFETLNDRGLELSKADLLKNYLFGRSQDRIKEVQQRWWTMIGAIESVGGEALILTYIRHLWSSMYGPTRDRELFLKIRGTVKSKQAAIDFGNDLAENATPYAAIFTPSHELWNDYSPVARKCIATLRQLEMEQVRPLLLAIVGRLPKPDVVQCLRLLVCCSVRFLIVGGAGAGTMEKYYAECGKAIRDHEIKTPKNLLSALKKVVPGDAAFSQEFAHATVGKSSLARYYLSALQQKVDDEEQPEYVPNDDQGEITLEHVMPQAASPHWPHIDDDTRRLWSRRIGNLALLKKHHNAAAGSDSIQTKAKILGASQFSLTAEFKKVKEWGPKEIAKRQARLAKIAVDTWPLKV